MKRLDRWKGCTPNANAVWKLLGNDFVGCYQKASLPLPEEPIDSDGEDIFWTVFDDWCFIRRRGSNDSADGHQKFSLSLLEEEIDPDDEDEVWTVSDDRRFIRRRR
jgi:hypothetical protein